MADSATPPSTSSKWSLHADNQAYRRSDNDYEPVRDLLRRLRQKHQYNGVWLSADRADALECIEQLLRRVV